jgi:hypothetical protein
VYLEALTESNAMSDFINKAIPENDFNNGGSTLGTPGGGIAGPQTQLSNQNQEGVAAALEANVDTAQTNQIGATAAGNQNRAFSSANQPCNPPKSIPYAVMDISGGLLKAYNDYTAGELDWEYYGDILLSAIGFDNKKCECYTPIIDLGTLAGSVAVGFLAKKFIQKMGKFQGLIRRTSKAKFEQFFNDNRQVYEFTGTYTNLFGDKNTIKFSQANYFSPTDMPGLGIGREQTLINLRTIVRRYKKRIGDITEQINSENYFPGDLVDLVYEKAALEQGISELNSIGGTFSNYHLALQNLARRTTNELMNNPWLWLNDKKLSMEFLSLTGVAIASLSNLLIARPMQCFGSNVELNDNCECVCTDGAEDCSAIPLGLWQNLYDYGMPGFIPRANELKTCKSCDCHLKPQYVTNNADPWGQCYCTYCEPGYTWFDGWNCPCLIWEDRSYFTSNSRGKCIANTELGFNKVWNEEKCQLECPEGSDLAERRPKGKYARIEDNGYPTGHYLYRTGCDYVCDGELQLADGTFSQFPPDCGEGYIWDGSPTVCNCVSCPVKLFYCQEEGTAISCDECPEGFTCSGVEGSDAYICSKSIYVTSSVDSPTYVGSSDECVSGFGVGAFGNSQWSSYFECSASS